MDLKHIIPQQRRRSAGPALDIQYSVDRTNVPRVGPTPTFTRASSGTFVNENRRIVGKTTSTTSLNPANVAVGGVAVFEVPSGSVVGWLNNSVVSVMVDSDGNDQIGSEAHVTGTLIHKTDTAITLLVTSKAGTATVSSWFVSYRGVRIDHDPATGLCLGHLHEGARTNLWLRSENFASASWTKNGGSISNIANVSPSGRSTSELFNEDATTGTHRLFQSSNYVSGTSYTISVYLKFAGRQYVVINFPAIASGSSVFDIQNGAVMVTPATTTTSIINAGNGWYRCSITATATSTTTQSAIIAGSINSTGTTSYTGLNGPAFYIFGAQLEAGLEASSYIPTTISTASRSDDVNNITGTSFTNFYNQTEGTIYSEMRHYANEYTGSYLFDSGNRLISAFGTDFNPSANQISTYVTSGPPNYNNVANFQTTYTRGSRNKTALAVKQNDFAASYNGATALTDTSGVFPASPMNILNIGTNTGQRMRGHIMCLTYYQQRLANTRLPTLTATVTETIVYNGVAIWYNGEGLIETS